MKWLLLFSLFLSFSGTAQNVERLHVQFVEDNDSFPDCKTLFYANGSYIKPNYELPELDLPNITAVHPSELTFNRHLNFGSFAPEALKFGSIEIDREIIDSLSLDEVKKKIWNTPDSSSWYYLIRDDAYLWNKFNIVVDRKERTETLHRSVSVDSTAPFPVNCAVSGIIDGVFVMENHYYQIQYATFSDIPMKFHSESKRIRESIQPKLDSLLKPFYLSNYELTNGEYREFIDWVFDSIQLHMAYQNLPYSEAKLLLNCPNKVLKELDSVERDQQALKYGLTTSRRKKIDDISWFRATESMYYPRPKRYYKRIERDTRKLIYRQNDSFSVAIYPDTLGFFRQELGMVGEFIGSMSWHPAYRNYPVTNLTKDQILAYCHWKQRQLNKKFNKEGLTITVRPPYLREYEFALKAVVDSNNYWHAITHPNTYFTRYDREIFGAEFPFYQAVNYNPLVLKRGKKLNKRTPSLEYQLWYQANTLPDTPFKFLNGNVSELVLDRVDSSSWEYFEMGTEHPNNPANYVVGTNFYNDAKTKGDDQYNAALYKSVLTKGESSPYVGVRLVYQVEKKQ